MSIYAVLNGDVLEFQLTKPNLKILKTLLQC